jgi:hypothetical protein
LWKILGNGERIMEEINYNEFKKIEEKYIICHIRELEKEDEEKYSILKFAMFYHEICREMVNKQIGMITKPTQPYIEWKDLTDEQKKGRIFVGMKLNTFYKLHCEQNIYFCEECNKKWILKNIWDVIFIDNIEPIKRNCKDI